LLHESVTWTIVIGMAVILAGTVLTNLRKRNIPQAVLERDPAVA
jgi:drug/metabolite transporter (DMT)-like permease